MQDVLPQPVHVHLRLQSQIFPAFLEIILESLVPVHVAREQRQYQADKAYTHGEHGDEGLQGTA